MIHGYHVIWGAYGFWLPNDPRGSWSDFVSSWELARFGRATKSIDRVDVEPDEYAAWRERARRALKYSAVTLSGEQVLAIAEGFRQFARKSGLGIWACSILPEHVHLVLARHRYKIEQAANLLKGEATRRLLRKNLHSMKQFQKTENDRLPSVWGGRTMEGLSGRRRSDLQGDPLCRRESDSRRQAVTEMEFRDAISGT